MSKSIVELLEELPKDNLTAKILNTLDFIIPGEYQNINDFEEMITSSLKIKNPKRIRKVKERAIDLYDDKKNGYRTAVWLYQTVDNTDKAIAAAALADKVGDTFSFIPFLDKLTPKADAVQSIDLKMKLAVELIAYMKMNGITLNPVKFAQTVAQNYRHESLMRMTALVSIDGVIPLGTNFITEVKSKSEEDEKLALANNASLGAIKDLIPSDNPQGFLDETFNSMSGWMSNLTSKAGLNREMLTERFGGFIDFAGDKLDYLAAFLDASCNFVEHTGIQTVARHVVHRAYKEYIEETGEEAKIEID